MRVLMVELYCKNYEHVKFNSGLIATLINMYSDLYIEFYSEDNHNVEVLNELKKNKYEQSCLKIISTDYNLNNNQWLNFMKEKQIIKSIYNYANQNDFDIIIFSSIMNTGIINIKNLLNNNDFDIETILIPHSILQGLIKRPIRIWNRLIDIDYALKKESNANIRYLALSEAIYKSLGEKIPITNWEQINHPYIFNYNEAKINHDNNITLGMMGALRYGFDIYCELAHDIKKIHNNVNFKIIGHIDNLKYLKNKYINYIENLNTEPISYEKFEDLSKSIDYLVWIPDPSLYKYTASCVLLDSFNYLKPGIYLKNPLIEEYFNKMGDIGYICDDYKGIFSTINNLLNQNDADVYKTKVENIRNGRDIFTPEYVSKMLKVF